MPTKPTNPEDPPGPKCPEIMWFLPPGAFLGDVVEATNGTTTSGRW